MYDTTINAAMINKISQDIFLKYLSSLFDNGFSGVSSGQSTAITKTATNEIQNKSKEKSYDLDNHIITIHARIESADMISHLPSVDA